MLNDTMMKKSCAHLGCFNIYIRNVKSELYDYKFVVLNEIEKPTFQAIKEYIELYGWDSEPYSHNFYGQENFFYSKSEKGNELITLKKTYIQTLQYKENR